MIKAGTADAALSAALPAVTGTPVIPTEEESAKAKEYLAANWANAVS
jgi:putative spermidine/putrescine transport system substrate-binding protein